MGNKYHVWCEGCDFRRDCDDSHTGMLVKTRHATTKGHHVLMYQLRRKPILKSL